MLDQNIGLQAILASNLTNLILTGKEELEEMPGKTLYALSGELSGTKINELSYGLIGKDPMQIKLWIDPNTFELYRAFLTEYPGVTDQEKTWTIDFWDFDKVEEITPPF